MCKIDNRAGRVYVIDCAFCYLEYKCVCPFVLAVFAQSFCLHVCALLCLQFLFVEVSFCMLTSILIHHITRVSILSNLQFKINSYVEDTKNRMYICP